MKITDLSLKIGATLVEQLRDLSGSFKDFPFHISLRDFEYRGPDQREHYRGFVLYWTVEEVKIGTPEQNNTVSKLQCQVIGSCNDHIILRVTPKKTKRYFGQDDGKTGNQFELQQSHNFYKQEWREKSFLIEANASALWTIMEAHANFENQVSEVMEQ
jgi:hypothetical protein